MRRVWVLGAILCGAALVCAVTVRPERWSAGALASAAAGQLAGADVTRLVAEAAPALRPYLRAGHLAAAAAPLRGATVSAVTIEMVRAGRAEATVRYSDGRSAAIGLVRPAGAAWQISGLG